MQSFEYTKKDYEKHGDSLIEDICAKMNLIYDQGYYAGVEVTRSWSEHNPVIGGDFARPDVYSWYLKREFLKLLEKGASIKLKAEHKRKPLHDPNLLSSLDESNWDYTRKKLFLFHAERMDLSLDRLAHYTGTDPKYFQRYILFTNYQMHVDVFNEQFEDCIKPTREGVQMPAYHHVLPNNEGITLINIGVGPSNAKTITDHIAVLRPDAMIMVGHCGGLRNHQEIGDFVLATGYMRNDHVLDHAVPREVPILSNYLLNQFLLRNLDKYEREYRLGNVFTTANRNWEFSLSQILKSLQDSRSIAIDMESATVAANGFRYRVPNATLLCVSDKPLHGKPKLTTAAQDFYQNSKELHLQIVIDTINDIKANYPEGLPNDSIRAFDEPLMGGL